MRIKTVTRNAGIVAGVLVTVAVGPSATVAAALDEANRAPLHTRAAVERTASAPLVRFPRLIPA